MKTVRFTEVVEQCGRPHAHALWVAPEDDPEFVRARKADRVMTVEPTPGGKADVGTVGFDSDPQKGNLFLIFPRSLKAFHGARIVGIKFDLVDQPATLTPNEHQIWTHTGRRKKPPSHHHDRTKSRSESPRLHNGNHHPEPETTPPSETPSSHASRRRSAPPASSRGAPLTRSRQQSTHRSSLADEVRAALEELRAGKTVAAYQRLERALKEAQE